MEDFFPGLRDEVVAAGAQLMDAGEAQILTPHGWAARGETGLPMLAVSRTLLETAIRHRVSAKIEDGVNVVVLRFDGSTVDGVRVWSKDSGAEEVITADLVVLAAGRSAKLSEWLAGAGVEVPVPVPATRVDGGRLLVTLQARTEITRRTTPTSSWSSRGRSTPAWPSCSKVWSR